MTENIGNNLILVGALCGKTFIKSIGHMTANLSFPIREYLYHLIDNSNNSMEIYIDLSETGYMDSTFMGLLVGVEKKTSKKFNTHLSIVNASPKAIEYLENLHLNKLLRMYKMEIPVDVIFCVFNDEFKVSERNKTQIIFDAHQALSEICAENESEFKSLQAILKTKLEQDGI